MSPKPVRVAVIGTGFARTTQLPALRAVEGLEVTVVASARRERAEKAALEHGVRAFTDSWEEAIGRDDVDLVVIPTPPHLHRRIALAAVRAGKHVLCEKPMALNASEAEDMAGAADEARVLSLIDHELRFVPARLRLRELVREGFCGTLRHVRVHWASPFRADPQRPWDWWSDEEKGGGLLGALGSHVIDYLRWTIGEVSSVGAQLRTFLGERPDGEGGRMKRVETDDYAALVLRLLPHAGPPIEAAVTLTAVATAADELWEVTGSRGTLRLGADGRLFGQKRNETATDLTPAGPAATAPGLPDNDWARGFLALASLAAVAIPAGRNDVPDAATFRDGWRVQQILDAARIAASDERVLSTGAWRPALV